MTRFAKHWLKPDAYPIIFFGGFASAFATWFGCRTLFFHNDVVINKSNPHPYISHDYKKMLDRNANLQRGVNVEFDVKKA